jgi:uncharacterized membrane protein
MEWLKRFFRHVWMSPWIAARAFPRAALDAIEAAIAAGEKTHRGQVRFIVEAELSTAQLWSGVTARGRAQEVFAGMGVWNTEENNGVLVYVQLADRKVEVIADRGIDRHVGAARWQAICKEMEHHFRKREFTAGSVSAVEKISAELAHYFPADGRQLAARDQQSDRPVML